PRAGPISSTTRGSAAGVALAARPAAHQGELAALAARVALVALEARLANLILERLRLHRRAGAVGLPVGVPALAERLEVPAARRAECIALGLGRLLGLGLAMDGVAAQVIRFDLGEVEPAEVGDGQLAEDVVDDRGRHLDVRVAL